MVGTIASVATLVLFVFYFIGKGIAIHIGGKLVYEPFEFYLDSDEIPESKKVAATYDLGDGESIVITSTRGVNSVKCYAYQHNTQKRRHKSKNLVFEHGFLNVGQSIEIKTYLAECVPEYYLEYVTCDYLKGFFPIQCDIATCNLQKHIKLKHTWKSFLYYLVK